MFIDPVASLMVLMIHYKICVNRASVRKDVVLEGCIPPSNVFADNVKKKKKQTKQYKTKKTYYIYCAGNTEVMFVSQNKYVPLKLAEGIELVKMNCIHIM